MQDSNDNDSARSKQAGEMALRALVWALSDERRAQRLLALTGLDPSDLRSAIGTAGTQAAILSFLESHEPDLIACAVAIDVSPAALVNARLLLEGQQAFEGNMEL